MAEFMAMMIIQKYYTYQEVVINGPMLKYKERVDAYLTKEGREDLIISAQQWAFLFCTKKEMNQCKKFKI